jgi:hypothetical protein
MVLDKFGPTLSFLFQFCDGQFSLKTVIELVDQLVIHFSNKKIKIITSKKQTKYIIKFDQIKRGLKIQYKKMTI